VAGQLPVLSKSDSRIGYINYSKGDVAELRVQRGTVTRVALGEDERILANGVATGFSADCASTTSEWCIRADAGTNQIFIKPKDSATHNNLELRTNKHDYSIAIRVLPDTQRSRKQASAMYRVMFRYPATSDDVLSSEVQAAESGRSEKGVLKQRMDRAIARPKNWAYTMQVLPGAQDFAPSLVFDDGRFTYFRFAANREIPTIYAVSPDGEEARVNFHVDEHDDNIVAVERLGRHFVLRLGKAAVGIWNEKWDAEGVPSSGGTTVVGVIRDVQKGAGNVD
jgi:type IV secretion system protein VirB9